jgi:hypothetical protein
MPAKRTWLRLRVAKVAEQSLEAAVGAAGVVVLAGWSVTSAGDRRHKLCIL